MAWQSLARFLAILVTFIGVIVIVGWLAGVPILKSIMPHWVTMKFSTALCFVLSGITLGLIARAAEGKTEIPHVVLPITSGAILLLMVILLASTVLGVRTGIEDLFVQETAQAVHTTTPGRPSIGTMISFILIATAGILAMLNMVRFTTTMAALGWIVVATGGAAVLGYMSNQAVLYYAWPGISTAMALHTAILFVCLGAGLVAVAKQFSPPKQP